VITLPAKFATENAKADNTPAVIVKLLQSELSAEETTATDWGNNSGEVSVDYTPTPPNSGDVILNSTNMPIIIQNVNNSWNPILVIFLTVLTNFNNHWQSFSHSTAIDMLLTNVQVRIRQKSPESDPAARADISCEIWSAGKGAKIGNTVTFIQAGASSGGDIFTFDFSGQSLLLSKSTEYWIRIFATNATSLENRLEVNYQNTNVYTSGQLDVTGTDAATNIGDLMFTIVLNTVSGNYYVPSGWIQTQTMDLGSIPTVDGEVILTDIRPANTNIIYEAWGSNTGAFAGEELYMGVVVDGQKVPSGAYRRYFRVKATLSTTDQSYTPTLNSIKVAFATYTSYADTIGFGYEPAVLGISSLTTTIDTFKASTIGQMTVKLAFISSLSDYLKTANPKNKIVKILAGFVTSDFTEVDFIDFFWGQIDDWAITNKDEVTLTIKDYKKEWAVDVPAKWETTADDVVWTSQHPSDVILDILQNQINVRNSKIDVSSFDILKASLPGWVVTRTITGNPEQADKLIEELRVLMGAFFVPQGDGKISIKRFDALASSAGSLTDANTFNQQWTANAGSLINDVFVYSNWDGNGDNTSDFGDLRIGVDVTSQVNYDEDAVKEIKDKWTRQDAHTLFTNGSFETGDTSGWTLFVNTGAGAAATLNAVAATPPFKGAWKGNVNITNGGPDTSGVVLKQTGMSITSGHTYKITFGVTTNVNYTMEVKFRRTANPFLSYTDEAVKSVNVTSTYAIYEVTYVANVTASDLAVHFLMGVGPTSVDIDEARIVDMALEQTDDLVSNILTRYATPPEKVTLDTDLNMIALEVGDIVNLTARRAPSSDMAGVANLKMQIVNKNMDFKKNKNRLTLLRV